MESLNVCELIVPEISYQQVAKWLTDERVAEVWSQVINPIAMEESLRTGREQWVGKEIKQRIKNVHWELLREDRTHERSLAIGAGVGVSAGLLTIGAHKTKQLYDARKKNKKGDNDNNNVLLQSARKERIVVSGIDEKSWKELEAMDGPSKIEQLAELFPKRAGDLNDFVHRNGIPVKVFSPNLTASQWKELESVPEDKREAWIKESNPEFLEEVGKRVSSLLKEPDIAESKLVHSKMHASGGGVTGKSESWFKKLLMGAGMVGGSNPFLIPLAVGVVVAVVAGGSAYAVMSGTAHRMAVEKVNALSDLIEKDTYEKHSSTYQKRMLKALRLYLGKHFPIQGIKNAAWMVDPYQLGSEIGGQRIFEFGQLPEGTEGVRAHGVLCIQRCVEGVVLSRVCGEAQVEDLLRNYVNDTVRSLHLKATQALSELGVEKMMLCKSIFNAFRLETNRLE